MIIVNLTGWESVEALREFVYKNAHYRVLRDQKRWFEKFDGPYYAMWWILAGHLPSIEEGKERLEYLREHSDTPYVFSFKNLFPEPVVE
jgi:Domain of unknown function (DUF3291)